MVIALANRARRARGCSTPGDDRIEIRQYAVKRYLFRLGHAAGSARYATSIEQLVMGLAPVMAWGVPPRTGTERTRFVRAHRKSVQRWLDDLQAAGVAAHEPERDQEGRWWRTQIVLLAAPEPSHSERRFAERRARDWRSRARRRRRRGVVPRRSLESIRRRSAAPTRRARAVLARSRALATHDRRRRQAVEREIALRHRRAGTPSIHARAWLRHERVVDDDGAVETPDRSDSMPLGGPGEPADSPAGDASKKRRNWWIWICALLAVVAAGLLIWALTIQSDLDSTQQDLANANGKVDSTGRELDSTKQELDSTQQELDSTKQDVEDLQGDDGGRAAAVLLTGKALYEEFARQLDATNEDLAATQADLDKAQKAASDAEKDAEAAKKDAADAGDETERAKAEADQAQAEVKSAESKAAIARDCAKAYISAFGGLFEGASPSEQAPAVRKQLSSITADCKSTLAGT